MFVYFTDLGVVFLPQKIFFTLLLSVAKNKFDLIYKLLYLVSLSALFRMANDFLGSGQWKGPKYTDLKLATTVILILFSRRLTAGFVFDVLLISFFKIQ